MSLLTVIIISFHNTRQVVRHSVIFLLDRLLFVENVPVSVTMHILLRFLEMVQPAHLGGDLGPHVFLLYALELLFVMASVDVKLPLDHDVILSFFNSLFVSRSSICALRVAHAWLGGYVLHLLRPQDFDTSYAIL